MEQSPATHIYLSIPGQPEFVGVVRLAAAGIAHRLMLSMEDSDDLKLAVTEACGHLLGRTAAPVEVDWSIEGSQLAVTVSCKPTPGEDIQAEAAQWSEIGLFLIHALMEEVDQFESDDRIGIRMVKRFQRTDDE